MLYPLRTVYYKRFFELDMGRMVDTERRRIGFLLDYDDSKGFYTF
jgi:hypothetical protein